MEGEARRIDPLYDKMFLRVFGSEESDHLTGSLVNLVLQAVGEEPIEGLRIVAADSSVIEGRVDGKSPRLDVALSAPGSWIDVEAQRRTGATLERMMCYAAKMQCAHLTQGMSYADLPQAVVIAIVDSARPLVPGDDPIGCCRYCWDSTLEPIAPADRSLLIGIDLAKIRKRYTRLDEEVLADELTAWLYLLARGYKHEGEVEEMAETFPTLEEFARMYGIASDDPALAQEYENFELAEHDRATYEWDIRTQREEALREGRAEGMAQGRAEGMAQGRAEGVREGVELGRASLAESLAALGVDRELIERAVEMDKAASR